MTVPQFKKLISLIRRTWSSKEGSVVKLFSTNEELLLSVGTHYNQGLMAENCKVWDENDESLLYDGALDSIELQKIFTAHKICGVKITIAKDLDKKIACCTTHCTKYNNIMECPSKKCRIR